MKLILLSNKQSYSSEAKIFGVVKSKNKNKNINKSIGIKTKNVNNAENVVIHKLLDK